MKSFTHPIRTDGRDTIGERAAGAWDLPVSQERPAKTSELRGFSQFRPFAQAPEGADVERSE
jgi:hypothetical protein